MPSRAPVRALDRSGVPAKSQSDNLISPREAAEFLGVTERQLQQMRRRGDGPRFVPMGHKTVRYSLAVLRTWVEERTVANTSEARELKDGAL